MHSSLQPLFEQLEQPLTQPEIMLPKLQALVALLAKWNKAYNLTAVRDIDNMYRRHVLDSLVVVPYLEGPNILDVGTGPGFPGLPLAIALPDWQFSLLDSNSKKTRFVQQAVIELKISNVTVVTDRIENLNAEQGFNTIMSRATFSCDEFIIKSGPYCLNKGLFLAMKGGYPKQEISAIPSDIKVEKVVPVRVPGLEAKRHLVLARNT